MKESKILLIYTGGTIGMIEDPESGSLKPLDFNQLMQNLPELKRLEVDINIYAFDKPIDSSEAGPEDWKSMARVVETHYNDYDGFVLLHGTDTMAYSASALSFMLSGLRKPVVFTGSQLPVGKLRTDGKENLITSIEIAAARFNGEPRIQEVVLYFESRLFRGNRTVKISAENFDAIDSPNFPELARVGVHILYDMDLLYKSTEPDFKVKYALEDNVAVLKMFPGIRKEIVHAILNVEELKGVVLETFGSGNAITADWFIDALAFAIKRGVKIVNVSQCLSGFVTMGKYGTSTRLSEIGVISGGDMTTEAALVKMMSLLPEGLDLVGFEQVYTQSLRGERTSHSSLV